MFNYKKKIGADNFKIKAEIRLTLCKMHPWYTKDKQ